MARWQSGDAAACKAVNSGSIPLRASKSKIFFKMIETEEIPIKNDLILIGGGHAHLSVLMKLSKNPIDGNRITLISNEIDTPYSGMIPGYIEGIYSWRDSSYRLV